jgi:hypothetical protein
MAVFHAKVADGLSKEAAAQHAIKSAAEKAEKQKLFAPRDTSGEKKLLAEVALLLWIARKGISFNAMEDEAFKLYHSTYNWQLPPGRKRLSNSLLRAVYGMVLDHQKELLGHVQFFALTTDSSTVFNHRTVSITIHFVHPIDWQLHSLCTSVIPVPEAHTWQNLTSAIAVRLSNIVPRRAVLVSTVTDNGANFVKVAASLHLNLAEAELEGLVGRESWDDPVPGDGADLDLAAAWQCVAHKAALVAIDVLGRHVDAIGPSDGLRLLERVRVLIRYIRASASLSTRLCEAQRARKERPKVLQLDVPTRWLSAHEMLCTFLHLYDDVLKLGLDGHLDEFTGSVPTLSEVKTLRAFAEVLEPLADFVRQCEGERSYVSIAITPVLYVRVWRAAADGPEDFALVKLVKKALRERLKVRLGYLISRPNLALAAAALHPAFGHLSFVPLSVRDAVWKEVAKWANEFDHVVNGSQADAGDILALNLPAKSQTEYHDALSGIRRHFESHKPAFDIEIRKDDAFEPLAWWKNACTKYPAVAAIGFLPRMMFCVPATSAPSERVFSALNATVTRHRSLLTDYKREMLTVIRAHLCSVPIEDFLQKCAAHLRRSKKRSFPDESDDEED